MERKFIHRILVGSIILSILICIIALGYSMIFLNVEEQACYDVLLSSSAEAGSKIESNFKNDKASLRILAKVIAQSDNLESNAVNNQLGAYAVNNYINNIAILTPDNKILQSRHTNIENTIISYDIEIKKGEHISNLQPSTFLSNKYVLRNYVPIGNRSKVSGILFTELDTDALVKEWSPSIYNGEATFCVVDRKTKEILINGLGEGYTTIDDIENNEIVEGIVNSEIGYGELKVADKNMLVAYRPMGIESWDVLIIIEKAIVLKPVNTLGKYLILAIGIGTFALFGYIVWILRLNSKSVHEAKEAANIDVLTGLQNRTSYENYCSRLKNDKIVNKIKCIYIDVNGLHEINNNKGHLAGDMMLKLVAEVLKETFEGAKIYRIGGDEFVIFSDDKLERVRDKIKSAYDTILKNEYHISYGLSYGEVLEDIIKDSEIKMYDMKKAYYKSIGKEVRNKLETK